MGGAKKYKEVGPIIVTPHNHDVLCGRGGLTNQHVGNEWFRRLVRSNRALYRSCPKHTKLLVAKAIVQAVQEQEPAGRFLELADKDNGTWRQIPYKRAVDKTSQALREKEQPAETPATPEEVAQLAAAAAASKSGSKGESDLSDLAKATLKQAGLDTKLNQEAVPSHLHPQQDFAARQLELDHKRKASEPLTESLKPDWWRQGMPLVGSFGGNMQQTMAGTHSQYTNLGEQQTYKRMRIDMDEAPLPPEPLQTRQSSLFRFFNGTGIFGKTNEDHIANSNHVELARNHRFSGSFSFSGGARNSFLAQQPLRNASDLISMEAQAFEDNDAFGRASITSVSLNPQQSMGLSSIDPLPLHSTSSNTQFGQSFQTNEMSRQEQSLMFRNSNSTYQHRNVTPKNTAGSEMEEITTIGLMDESEGASPPMSRLTTQVSDWLISFWPLGKDQDGTSKPVQQRQKQKQQQDMQQEMDAPPPPPPGGNLERSMSSTFFALARSPSQFLTSLKSGVTSLFGGDEFTPIPIAQGNCATLSSTTLDRHGPVPPMIGTASTSGRDSLLDDYEESPLELRLRSVTSL